MTFDLIYYKEELCGNYSFNGSVGGEELQLKRRDFDFAGEIDNNNSHTLFVLFIVVFASVVLFCFNPIYRELSVNPHTYSWSGYRGVSKNSRKVSI